MERVFADTRVAVVLGVAVAVTAAVYVAFGPPSVENPLTVRRTSSNKGGRKTRRSSKDPRGLHNSGNTCFVNAVLQAIASCPAMMMWLEERKDLLQQDDVSCLPGNQNATTKEEHHNGVLKGEDYLNSLQMSLLSVLRVTNGLRKDGVDQEMGDPEIWAPAQLFRALRAHGWVINTDEQDAHEFLQVLLSTVEEEIQKKEPKIRPASLFDTSGIDTAIATESIGTQEEVKRDSEVITHVDPCLETNTTNESEEKKESTATGNTDKPSSRPSSRSSKRPSQRLPRCKTRSNSSGVYVRNCGEELSVESVLKQTKLAASLATPFTGTLTNKVSFRGSGKCKSPTNSTVFNNITLSLPANSSCSPSSGLPWMSGVSAPPVTVETLLQMFVSIEAIDSVPSDKLEIDGNTGGNLVTSSKAMHPNKLSPSEGGKQPNELVKQLTFARLPDCLCFHIQRTAFDNGVPRKRNDPVLFPSVLNMDNYVYTRQLSKKRMLAQMSATGTGLSPMSGSNIQSPHGDAETPSCASSWLVSPDYEDDSSLMTSSISSVLPEMSKYRFNNNYQLRAVVVHIGAIDSGHYVTYRREPDNSLETSEDQVKPRWFYTSDSLVREVTLDDVLGTNPYMLFYEKLCAEAQ